MSLEVLTFILNRMGIYLNEEEKLELYNNILRDFGIIGRYNECEELKRLYMDEYYRKKLEEYIRKYLERKSIITV